MRVAILALWVTSLTQAQRFQSFPAASQQPAQQPQFIFNPQQQVRAQQQQVQPTLQQPGVPQFNPQAVPLQFRQPVLAQTTPQQFRQPASTQAVLQQHSSSSNNPSHKHSDNNQYSNNHNSS